MPDSNTTESQCPFSNIDWDDLLETIDAGKCILFFDTASFETSPGEQMDQALSKWLDANNPKHEDIRLYNSDDFFLFRRKKSKRVISDRIREFYNQEFPEAEALLGLLAEVPFSMIFTLKHDNLLSRTYDKMGFDYQPGFYFKNRETPKEFSTPTKTKPLIYNLMGNIEEPESIVLTYGDFYDYLESIFKEEAINPDLKDELERADHYIFLGLPYEKWYFQLLLRVLTMQSDKLKEVERLALEQFENPNLYVLYEEEFKIEFLTGDPKLFIHELNSKCRTAGLLKKGPPPDSNLIEFPDLPDLPPGPSLLAFETLISEGRTTEVFDHLRAFLQHRRPKYSEQFNSLLVLQNRYKMLRHREIMGTIYPRDLIVELNQIIEKLIQIVNQAFK